jgi:glutamate formiminotransferase/formiminotetrahydrofolate cyclodeaminase
MRLCERALPMVERVAAAGNKNSISDAGVAALVLGAAVGGAYLNVLINLPGLKDASYAKDTKANAEKLGTLVDERAAAVVAAVTKSL